MTKDLIELRTFCNENDVYNVKRILKRNKIDFKFFIEEFYSACCNNNDKIVNLFLLEFRNRNYHIKLFFVINMIINHSANASFNMLLKFYKDEIIKYVNSVKNIDNFCRNMDIEIIMKVINYNPKINNYDIFAEKFANYLIYANIHINYIFYCLNKNISDFNKIINNSNIIEIFFKLYCNNKFNKRIDYNKIVYSYLDYDNSDNSDSDDDYYEKYYEKNVFKHIRNILHFLLNNYFVYGEKCFEYFLTFGMYRDEKLMEIIYDKYLQNNCDSDTFYKNNKSDVDDTFILSCHTNFNNAKMMKYVFPQIDHNMKDRICYTGIISDIPKWLSNGCCDFSTKTKSARKI